MPNSKYPTQNHGGFGDFFSSAFFGQFFFLTLHAFCLYIMVSDVVTL
jgi:hypothetical protein